MYQFSKRSLANMEGVNEDLVTIMRLAIGNSPYDFGIPSNGGKRTAEEQHQLYLAKVSKKDGYVKQSKHQSGDAVDIYLYIDGKASWDIDKLEKVWLHIKEVARQYGFILRWGGDWNMNGIRVDKDKQESFLDGGHFEIMYV